jgi:hypothetical protein
MTRGERKIVKFLKLKICFVALLLGDDKPLAIEKMKNSSNDCVTKLISHPKVFF